MFALEQAQEVLLKLGIGGGGGAVARNEHNVVPVGQRLTMRPQYLADAPAQQVAHYCVAQSPGGDDSEAGPLYTRTLARVGEGGEYKKTPCCG